jgi:predicted RNA-binding protein associated with RNAse of E/G family
MLVEECQGGRGLVDADELMRALENVLGLLMWRRRL